MSHPGPRWCCPRRLGETSNPPTAPRETPASMHEANRAHCVALARERLAWVSTKWGAAPRTGFFLVFWFLVFPSFFPLFSFWPLRVILQSDRHPTKNRGYSAMSCMRTAGGGLTALAVRPAPSRQRMCGGGVSGTCCRALTTVVLSTHVVQADVAILVGAAVWGAGVAVVQGRAVGPGAADAGVRHEPRAAVVVAPVTEKGLELELLDPGVRAVEGMSHTWTSESCTTEVLLERGRTCRAGGRGLDGTRG